MDKWCSNDGLTVDSPWMYRGTRQQKMSKCVPDLAIASCKAKRNSRTLLTALILLALSQHILSFRTSLVATNSCIILLLLLIFLSHSLAVFCVCCSSILLRLVSIRCHRILFKCCILFVDVRKLLDSVWFFLEPRFFGAGSSVKYYIVL